MRTITRALLSLSLSACAPPPGADRSCDLVLSAHEKTDVPFYTAATHCAELGFPYFVVLRDSSDEKDADAICYASKRGPIPDRSMAGRFSVEETLKFFERCEEPANPLYAQSLMVRECRSLQALKKRADPKPRASCAEAPAVQ
jgi:hypothetical protein